MSDILDYMAEAFEKELKDMEARHQKKMEDDPSHPKYVKYWAGEHKAGRDRSGAKAKVWGVTKDHTKAYNDAAKAKAKLTEDAAPTNVVSGGQIASKDVPLGTVVKRKPLEEVTGVDATEEEKFMFKQKQDQANQTG